MAKTLPKTPSKTPTGSATPLTTDPYRLYKLDGCDPILKVKIEKVLKAMDAIDWPMIVTDGVRNVTQQQYLWAQGRTRPGRRVTNADGVIKVSNHQSGKACDCTFLDPETGRPTWDARLPWSTYGECVKAVGLKWGGDWSTVANGLVDLPHAELP
jgi:peptidoglycan LD-endopeptidase CwlK